MESITWFYQDFRNVQVIREQKSLGVTDLVRQGGMGGKIQRPKINFRLKEDNMEETTPYELNTPAQKATVVHIGRRRPAGS
jgi:hypothetical protein